MSELLAVDWGSKRVGLAAADMKLAVVQPLPSLENDADLFAKLTKLCAQLHITRLIVGQPLGLNGQETTQTKQVVAFAGQLSRRLNLPVVMQDETLTSAAVHERFGNKSHDRDSESAVIILQDYLEILHRPGR
ncbi:Holliday junction resolvase RuvX [Candidatus Microgenomates bacterium]|nr:Holliday junction resolvase RuvX [Candidatus Microgenomates bacterium]